MTFPSYAVVIPTIGRARLALVAAADGNPPPTSIVVADNRRDATSALDLLATTAPLVIVRTHGRGPAAAERRLAASDTDWVAFLDDDVAIPVLDHSRHRLPATRSARDRGFDERFPGLSGEDADLGLRTGRAGYPLVWGERVTTHPLASPNRYVRGRTSRHLITAAAATAVLAALSSGRVAGPCARTTWIRVAAAAVVYGPG